MKTRFVLVGLLLALGGSPAALGADFNDNKYHMYILNDLDSAVVDVLVVPPVAAQRNARLNAIEKSIDAWETGIQAFGAPWLVSALEINRYTVGTSTIPQSALEDPEIIVLPAEALPFLIFGIGAASDYLVCARFGNLFLDLPVELPAGPMPLPEGFHQHAGSDWAMGILNCEDRTDNVCIVIDTNAALAQNSQRNMYDLNAHEFGHCLGIGHVGDALDFSAKTVPMQDIMSYQTTPSQVHCVSNLNVRGIEGTMAKALGRPPAEWLTGNQYVAMLPADYAQVACLNP